MEYLVSDMMNMNDGICTVRGGEKEVIIYREVCRYVGCDVDNLN